MNYGQYCGLARSLDVVGDRWTLLIVRELLAGRSRYGDIRSGLPGIATNLLADRLRRLEADGVVTREGTHYALTERGRALRPVIRELVRWAEPLMVAGPEGDHFDGRWLVVGLEALLQPSGRGCVEIRSGGAVVHVVARGDGVEVGVGPAVGADAVVTAEGELVLGLAAGHVDLGQAVRDDLLSVEGDVAVAGAVLGRPVSA